MDRALMDALVQTSYAVVAAVSEVGAAHDASLTQVRVLAILEDRELRMSDLARHLGLDRSSVTGLIDRAIARGLVERRPDPTDARAALVTLTASGRELAAAGRAEIAARLAPVLERLSGEEGATLRATLEKLLG